LKGKQLVLIQRFILVLLVIRGRESRHTKTHRGGVAATYFRSSPTEDPHWANSGSSGGPVPEGSGVAVGLPAGVQVDTPRTPPRFRPPFMRVREV
jgi:hypothetical protein